MNSPDNSDCTFVAHGRFSMDGAAQGPLKGLNFAVKDLYDVAGHATGTGTPAWYDNHTPAVTTAPVVQACLDAGAGLKGKTLTDEMAFSLIGANAHYGTPPNPQAPDRVPGGSSSGSASAVAQGLVDFSLGTDTGGSVRIPASFCGLFGVRPTHARVSADGVIPLASSFDTVGWFTRDVGTLTRVGDVLLGDDTAALGNETLIFPNDMMALCDADVIDALLPAFDRVADILPKREQSPASTAPLSRWRELFRVLQGYEAWQAHGLWITDTSPQFGPGIGDRFDYAQTVTQDQYKRADEERQRLIAPVLERLRNGGVLCLPTSPCIAPLRTASEDDLDKVRFRIIEMTAVAGLAGLPQVSLPMGALNGAPIGLSLIGAAGSDRALLQLADKIIR